MRNLHAADVVEPVWQGAWLLWNRPGARARAGPSAPRAGPACAPETMWGEPVIAPLCELIKACSLITGGMGSGKTMFALLPIAKIIQGLPALRTLSCGAIDPKGELFDRMLYLLAKRCDGLNGSERDQLLEQIVIIDFSNREAISSYNILHCPPDADSDFFISSRLETLRELLPASERPSVAATTVLRNAIAMLVETGRPAPELGRVVLPTSMPMDAICMR